MSGFGLVGGTALCGGGKGPAAEKSRSCRNEGAGQKGSFSDHDLSLDMIHFEAHFLGSAACNPKQFRQSARPQYLARNDLIISLQLMKSPKKLCCSRRKEDQKLSNTILHLQNSHVIARSHGCFQNRGKTPKMDGL